ncbi:outer membrane biogenesis protein BamB [Rubripirellula lacrimiformis]|uniref:Outer membrane biogenesis protein BamB n=1 Tax=Rubripirellula lacrimiformis TaxID=1930273 RepID=A0A517NG26_9BACT|nr:PQQ-binding-like beta-propeller repeat protein [Rubripirellula lacrimiformis]QDT06033.1 outer membrane biogenesis protein BamB [Rubripirellula lacrimiformis]
MHRLLILICLAAALPSQFGPRCSADETLMPPEVAAQLGLVESWQRAIATPYGEASIVDQVLNVDPENPHVYVEIVDSASVANAPTDKEAGADKPSAAAAKPAAAPGDASSPASDGNASDGKASGKPDNAKVLMRIAVGTPDRLGNPMQKKEAERLASNEIRRLKRRGIEAEMRTTEVARVTLYSISEDGTLEARDSETGRVQWLAQVGNSQLPYGQLGVTDQYLTVINGGNLIQVNATSGEVIKEIRTVSPPQFGAVSAGDNTMVITVGGGIESYSLTDQLAEPFIGAVAGRALAPPRQAPGSSRIAWATDQGLVYVIDMMGTPSILFRLQTDGLVTSRIRAIEGNRFFFATDHGQAYGLRATRSGEVMWSVPFGEPFFEVPLVAGEGVLMLSTFGRLHSLRVDNGDVMWDEPASEIAKLIGCLGERIFARTIGGSLRVLDLKTGKTIGTYPQVRPGRLLPNTKTNRLYFVSDSGAVQCLRPIDSELPSFNVAPDPQPLEEAGSKDKQGKAKDSSSPFTPAGQDPFGASKDPFGAGSDPFGGGDASDPFGGGDASDPFGGGDAMADPFGSDPFGN